MRYSKLLGKSLRQAPKEAESVSHKLLTKAGFIDQLAAGVYSFLPLGWRVSQKISNIIREELNKVGAQELSMPVLQPKSIWQETGRWTSIDPPLFVVKDRHEKEYALGPTHEEVITDIVRRNIRSYKDLPFSAYQIQDKFRNELRSTGGLLRTREFFMKDLYSFHTDEKDLEEFFKKMVEVYENIFERVGIKTIASQASGGTIGGNVTYEFQAPSEVGEDTVFLCESCGFAINKELLSERNIKEKCPECGEKLSELRSIEAGQVFSLGTKYSESMGAAFMDKDGKEKPIFMGCYGIGIGRLMGTIVEVSHDEKGISWPENIAPFAVHVVSLGSNEEVAKESEKIYEKLLKKGVEVLFDDRSESAGAKLADADLIGIPQRWVISEKTLSESSIEVKKRNDESSELVNITSV